MKSRGPGHPFLALSRGGVAAVLIVALMVGVPWGLVAIVGWPLPHHLPTLGGLRNALATRGIPNQTLLDALGCVAWLAWASVAISIAEEVAATAFGRGSKRLPFAGAFQPVAARLVAAVLLALFAFIRPDVPSKSSPRFPLAQQIQPTTVTLAADMAQFAAPLTEPAPAPTPTPTPTPNDQSTASAVDIPDPTYTVQPNDNLWSIAYSQLGDGADWPAIASLNLGRTMSDGRQFVDLAHARKQSARHFHCRHFAVRLLTSICRVRTAAQGAIAQSQGYTQSGSVFGEATALAARPPNPLIHVPPSPFG
jgi:hypothetical protein